MIKNLWLLPLLVIILLLIIVGHSYVGLDNLQQSLDKQQERLNLINSAAEIGNSVKQAEGDLLMYLITGNADYRSLFFERLGNLEKNLWKMAPIDNRFHPTLNHFNELQALGSRLANMKRQGTLDSMVASESYQADISHFHDLTDQVWKTGIGYVHQQTFLPQQKLQETFWEMTRAYLVLGLLGIVCIVAIILLMKRSEKELKLTQDISDKLSRLSNTDGLTGVSNRLAFDQALEIEFSRAKRDKTSFALLFIDIDAFSIYNNQYGHIKADEALHKIAEELSNQLRRPSDRIFRYTGNVFAMILPGTTDVLAFAEHCRKAVQELGIKHISSPANHTLTVSIGFGTYNPDLDRILENIIQRVDAALMRAKKLGRNRVCSANLNDDNENKLTLVKDDNKTS